MRWNTTSHAFFQSAKHLRFWVFEIKHAAGLLPRFTNLKPQTIHRTPKRNPLGIFTHKQNQSQHLSVEHNPHCRRLRYGAQVLAQDRPLASTSSSSSEPLPSFILSRWNRLTGLLFSLFLVGTLFFRDWIGLSRAAAHSSESHSILYPLYVLEKVSLVSTVKWRWRYWRSRHHTSPRKHCIVYWVERDDCVLASKLDINHHQIMNMIEIFANSLLGMSRGSVVNHQVSCRANSDFVCYMTRQDELAVVPANFNLDMWIPKSNTAQGIAYPLASNV